MPAERTPENPHGISRLTKDSIRWLSEAEFTEKQREAAEERSQRFRELYRMLGLQIVCHPDLSLEITWGADCSKWLGRA